MGKTDRKIQANAIWSVRKFRLARIWSNNELKKIAGLFDGKVINVSAGEDIDKEGATYGDYFSGASEYWISNYAPGSYRGFEGRDNEILIDLTRELPDGLEGAFDLVFNHTTLEHIFDLFTAFGNLCRLSRDVVIVVVPFAQEQHENEGYLDYWRFSPTCLRELFKRNGFSVLYESANNDFNTATYLFFVASRNAGRWKPHFPEYEHIETAGNWIGSIAGNRPVARLKDVLRRIRLKLGKTEGL